MTNNIQLSTEVAQALSSGKPVVALESTVFSPLGLPSPANRQAYEQSIQAVSERGAVAAVTAVIDGQARVGLSATDESRLFDVSLGEADGLSGEADGLSVEAATFRKVSVADLPIAVAQGWSFGATTVSASLSLAHQAGIKVFATGGIGGVHRENPNDVSADLTALARFPLATVCSGAKAFLDLPATLEQLETLGVAVVGYRTGEFPAFWCRESGLKVQHTVSTPKEATDIVRALGSEVRALGSEVGALGSGQGGVLLVVPPPEEEALKWPVVEQAVEEALLEVHKRGIKGGKVTPFILEHINKATNGGTLSANIALVANNAAVAADIAVDLAKGATSAIPQTNTRLRA